MAQTSWTNEVYLRFRRDEMNDAVYMNRVTIPPNRRRTMTTRPGRIACEGRWLQKYQMRTTDIVNTRRMRHAG